MRKIIIGIVIAGAVIIVLIVGLVVAKFNFTDDSAPQACTEEAKICPDGSAIGRIGPDCAFAPCPQSKSVLTEAEARAIAEKSCIKGGEALEAGTYNENSQTWWFNANLNATREGCNPACVVSAETKQAEINWRCTGLQEPEK